MGLRRDQLPICLVCRTKGWPSRRPPAIRVRGHVATKRHQRAAYWIPPEARWRGNKRHYYFDEEAYERWLEQEYTASPDPEWDRLLAEWKAERELGPSRATA